MSVNFSWDTPPPNPVGYIVGIDPFKEPTTKYVPSHAVASNILYALGFNYGDGMLESTFVKIEELFLGEDCTLLIEVTCGLVFNAYPRLWVECKIKNNELLQNILPNLSSGCGIEHTLEIKGDTELHSEAIRYINKALQIMKDRIWPYREQLIEFIKMEDQA